MPHNPVVVLEEWLGSSWLGRSFMGDGSGEGSRDLSELESEFCSLGSGGGGLLLVGG